MRYSNYSNVCEEPIMTANAVQAFIYVEWACGCGHGCRPVQANQKHLAELLAPLVEQMDAVEVLRALTQIDRRRISKLRDKEAANDKAKANGCTGCLANPGEGCLHKRTGEPIRWSHPERLMAIGIEALPNGDWQYI
ncbi:hypothetical protein [Streptomyces sp. AJS327]|uniref:hypothetical protein n=1 Tax=Streptomyces sp. AJS327 TaxID=2545265 RepID=UPI0015DE9FB1|nr:hypothetical protein [Streptomyces sp. AJS327]